MTMKTLSESEVRESIENNMDEFRNKAMRGKVDGKDVANLFGYGDVFNESAINEEDVQTDDAEKQSDDENAPEDTQTEEKAQSFDEFLKNTESNVKITKVSTEPSPIFGPNDTNDHNKYRVTISNENGSVWFTFWDSINNTKNGKTPTVEDVMYAFTLDCQSVINGKSFDEFKSEFGWDETDNQTAQRAYDGCRKMYDKAKKMFSEEQFENLIEISSRI